MKDKSGRIEAKERAIRDALRHKERIAMLSANPELLRVQRDNAILELVKQHGLKCWHCSADLSNQQIHVDHIYPKSKGGSSDADNLALACRKCNMAKGAMDPADFIEWLSFMRGPNSKTLLILGQRNG